LIRDILGQALLDKKGGESVGNVVKWRKKKMSKHKHKKLLRKTKHQRRNK
jgi:hypothetical protein